MSFDLELDVAATFRAEGLDLDASAALEAARLCAEHSVRPSDLIIKWEAFAISNNRGTRPPAARDLAALFSGRSAPSKRPPPLVRRAALPPPIVDVDDFFSYCDTAPPSAVAAAPVVLKEEEDIAPPPVISSGTALGRTVASLPGDDTSKWSPGNIRHVVELNKLSESSVKSTAVNVFSSVGGSPEFMHDPLDIAAEVLRERVRVVGARILERLHATGAVPRNCTPSPSAFTSASPNVVLALGRIKVELDGGGGAGRLNPASVILESEDGTLAKLNLTRVKASQKRLFLSPGMVVIVEGVNTNRHVIDVHAVHDNATTPTAYPVEERRTVGAMPNVNKGDDPVARVVVACGPFTLPTNLKYEPLDALLQDIASQKPDLVILLGPFVDAAHPLLKETLPVDFSALFNTRVLGRICEICIDTPRTHFCLIPGLSDVHHFAVCPQPRFRVDVPLSASIQLVPNPCVISLSSGEHAAVIGATSLPAVADLSGDSVCLNAGDRMSAIVSTMIRQESFYPIYPPSAAVPYDVASSVGLGIPECGVDLLVSPSVLQPFAKVVDGGVLAINPGILVRGASGSGNFAQISLPLRRRSDVHGFVAVNDMDIAAQAGAVVFKREHISS